MSEPKLPDPINAFVEAVNRGDTDSFLDFFLDDGAVDDSGRRFAGHRAIREWSNREFIGAKGHITVTGVEQQTKNRVNITADWVSNYFTGPSRFIFVLKGNRIQELRISGE
jgi:ketosteroid isomerase-like protein